MPYCANGYSGNEVAAATRMAGTAAGLDTAGRLDAPARLARSPG